MGGKGALGAGSPAAGQVRRRLEPVACVRVCVCVRARVCVLVSVSVCVCLSGQVRRRL